MVEMKPIIELINKKMRIEHEGEVMRAVASVGVSVDKERLVRAIEDARSFWLEGYNEGVNAGRPHGRWVDNHCTACGKTPLGEELWEHLDVEPPRFELCFPICPCCGAQMDEEET